MISVVYFDSDPRNMTLNYGFTQAHWNTVSHFCLSVGYSLPNFLTLHTQYFTSDTHIIGVVL